MTTTLVWCGSAAALAFAACWVEADWSVVCCCDPELGG
jgi:hypothetical protein